MADPSSLTISIDRTSMTLPPFVLCGHDATRDLSVSGYREPALQTRINYAPTGDGHGDTALAWSYQQTVISFVAFAERPESETAARAKIAELAACLARLRFTVTVTVDDAAPETWTCDPGSLAPVDDRSFTDLQTHEVPHAVTIPAYPIRSV